MNTIKLYLIIAILGITGSAVKAQSGFKTNESISSQLKNGNAPGLLFKKTEEVKKDISTESASRQSSGKQLRSNDIQNAGFEKQINTAQAQTSVTTKAESEVPLASDKPVEQAKPFEKPVLPKIVQ